MMSDTVITKQLMERMRRYLDYLKCLAPDSSVNITAEQIADAVGVHAAVVRQDLSIVSNGELPDVGYIIEYLIADLEHYLGYDKKNCAVLIGAGYMGHALMSYDGFAQYGVEIVAAFDIDSKLVGTTFGNISILPVAKLPDLCRRTQFHIGIITVPAFAAQEVCDVLVENGVKSIWNFAPRTLKVPEDVMVINENMAASLSLLSQHLA